MVIKRILEVSVFDEWFDDGPDVAQVTITKSFINRVIKLNKAVKKLGVYKISEFDCSPDWLYKNGDEYEPWDDSMDVILCHVTESGVQWDGYVKNTNIQIGTQEIFISELLEIKRVLDAPPKDLPLFISNLKYDTAKDALQQRLSS